MLGSNWWVARKLARFKLFEPRQWRQQVAHGVSRGISFPQQVPVPVGNAVNDFPSGMSRFGDSHGYVAPPWLSPKRLIVWFLLHRNCSRRCSAGSAANSITSSYAKNLSPLPGLRKISDAQSHGLRHGLPAFTPDGVMTNATAWRLIIAILLAMIVSTLIHAPAGGATTLANHPVSIVEADVYVNRGQTTVRLTCFAEDLELLQGVEPLDNGNYDSAEILEATQDHAKYLAEKIRFLDENGDPFPVRVTGITDVDIPAEGIEAGTLMNFTMGFELELDYESPPEFMTIQQDMVAEGQLLPSELKVLLKQAGSKTPYRKMLKPGIPETFRFDWDNPPISPEASKEEWDNWFEEQRQDTLGIASYSSVYSFIYINDHEVRHEILIPLANLTTMMDFERADQGFLSVEEQAEAAKQIELFFSVGNPVKIDGVEVQPIFDRIDFYGLDLRDFANRAAKRKVSMASGRVGIIMRYPAKGRPIDVEVTWDKFNDSMRSIESVAFAYKEIEKVSFSMFLDRNVFHWKAGDTPELPPVTNVDLNDSRYHAQPVTVPIPVGTAVGLGLALVALLFSLFNRLRSVALSAAAVLTVAGYLAGLRADGGYSISV